MKITKLSLTNFCGFEQTDIEFQSGVNVIAGVNGAGKSSLLYAMRILLSQALKEVTRYRATAHAIPFSAIRLGTDFAEIETDFTLGEETYSYFLHSNRRTYQELPEGEVRQQTMDTPDKAGFTKKGADWLAETAQPFALFFSPHRSVLDQGIRKTDAVSGTNAVYYEALEERTLKIRQIVDWWLLQIGLADEQPLSRSRIEALENALHTFVPEFVSVVPMSAFDPANLSATPTLMIVKADNPGMTFDVSQLSDGERGMLALVLETARRLSLAYPTLENPVRDGEALIMIDEVELHLHPKWQREVVPRLAAAFPKCQFIMTTHSPVVMSQVEARRIIVLQKDGQFKRPISTKGLLTDEILETVQGVKPEHQDIVDSIMQALDDLEVDCAEELLARLRRETETPNQLVSEIETLIGNTRALIEDATQEMGE